MGAACVSTGAFVVILAQRGSAVVICIGKTVGAGVSFVARPNYARYHEGELASRWAKEEKIPHLL